MKNEGQLPAGTRAGELIDISIGSAKQRLLEVVRKFISREFQISPFSFLSESDIKCALFGHLRAEFGEEGKIPISGTIGQERVSSCQEVGNRRFVARSDFDINLIHSEYPWDQDENRWNAHSKIDIVCLDPRSKNTKDPYFLWWQDLLVGIELKICTPDYEILNQVGASIADAVHKLEVYKNRGHVKDFSWLSLCFVLDEYMNYGKFLRECKEGVSGITHAAEVLVKRKQALMLVDVSALDYDNVYAVTPASLYLIKY
ncbi:MAG: hypothetical protein HQK87_07530 [Nitrospinae bacterium]|nr:hypothetical protein [Nitrospinota bacterium]